MRVRVSERFVYNITKIIMLIQTRGTFSNSLEILKENDDFIYISVIMCIFWFLYVCFTLCCLINLLFLKYVLQVLGFCVPDKPYDGDGDTTVVMVTELGEPIDLIKLLQMSWEDRLRVSSQVL